VSTKQDTARQFGRMARAYAKSLGHARGADLQILVNFLEPDREMIVLDVATGPGHTALAVALQARHVVAADLAPPMLAQAQSLASCRGLSNVSTVAADVEALPFPDGSFHAVTCRIAAHHFHDIGRAVREMARVVTRGGRVVIEDNSVPADPVLDRFLNGVEKLRDPTHVRSHTEAEWRKIAAAAGLDYQWCHVHRKQHRIPEWMERSGLTPDQEEEVRAVFATASPAARDYFEITFDDLVATTFTDDKLIFRAERT
jgi:ubiquinone/menaquinone biosynthesis C-methylase UbiE